MKMVFLLFIFMHGLYLFCVADDETSVSTGMFKHHKYMYSMLMVFFTEERVTLQHVLTFFTGADSIPPSGYDSVILNFSSSSPYPLATTCGLELTLPTKYFDYNSFKRSLDIGFRMNGGFGRR